MIHVEVGLVGGNLRQYLRAYGPVLVAVRPVHSGCLVVNLAHVFVVYVSLGRCA